MTTNPERLHYLLLQYAANNCTRKELLELLQAMEEAGHDEDLHNSLQSIWKNITREDAVPDIDKEKIFSNIMTAAPVDIRPHRRLQWLKVAAAAFVLLSAGLLYIYVNRNNNQPSQENIIQNNILKSDKAALINKPILTLANGSEVVLDDVPNGILVRQGNTTVTKLNNRQLEYKTSPATDEQTAMASFHTLTIPAGRQYEIILPDGSKIWLNAESSIRYPVMFTGNERRVEMTGEAYFEVEKSPRQPFRVAILTTTGGGSLPAGRQGRGEVEVLGTHFNINAYDDEQTIKTTLLEGSVFFSPSTGEPVPTTSREGRGKALKPGQQASLTKNGELQVKRVNAEDAIAWKQGELILNDVTMEEAARIIGRWHNVQFKFENPQLKSCRFTISFLKGETIQQMMDLISMYNDFDYQLSNNTVILNGKGCQ